MIYTCYYYAALEVNDVHILNGNLSVTVSRHFSAAGNDYEYFRDGITSIETVFTTGPLVNLLVFQVFMVFMIFMHTVMFKDLYSH